VKRIERRGFAMLAVVMLMALMAIIVIAVLSMSAADRRRAVRHTRAEVREGCVSAGLSYARSYFANRWFQDPNSWNLFLNDPASYNPMNLQGPAAAWGAATKAPLDSPAGLATLKAAHPELFLDFDADGAADAYIFIRDNYDEFPPAAVNFRQDNDQNAIVGAMCISNTMVPKREDNTLDSDRMLIESLLSVNNTAGATNVCQNGNCNNNVN
jgi:hypothetical protein